MPLYRRSGSSHWWVRIGRKTRKSTGTADREQAEEFERVLTERLWRLTKLGDRSAVSWREAAVKWLKDSKRAKRRDQEFLAWLSPKLDEQPLSAVAHDEVLEQLREDGLAEGWQHSTVDRMMGTVSAVLRHSLTNPPRVPMYRPDKGEPRWLTPEEFGRLCKELPPHLELAAQFAVLTLLRMRSMLRLTWDRIDLKNRRAWVPGAHMKGGLSHGLPLSREAVKVLRRLKAMNPEGAHVFQWNAKPIDDCNTLAFQKAVERAQVAPLRWHDLRHTGASWAVQGGVPLQQVMELGGWKDYRMALRYAHLAPDHLASAAELVGRNVAQRKSTRTSRSA
jgi:integrase